MPEIAVVCPKCRTRLSVDEQHAGQEVECGDCREVFVAESAPPMERLPAASRRGNLRDYHSFDDRDEYRPRRRRRRVRRDLDDDNDYEPRKSRLAYILLGVFLGNFGVHNFYAGYTSTAIWQLVITVVSSPLICVYIGALTLWIPYIWAIVEVCTIDRDADGRRME